MYVIYAITNKVNGKKYVGYTGNYDQRMKSHWSHGRRTTPSKGECAALYRAMRKYGTAAFTSEVIQSDLSAADVCAAERYWIAFLRTMVEDGGYNLTAGGEGCFQPSQETRARMSAAQKGRTHSPEIRAKIAAGLDTPEIRAKQSAASKGKTRSPATRAKMSAWQTGRILPSETLTKMSAVNKGKTATPETKAKMSASHKGRTHSPATKAKISAWQKGRKLTPEHRANISAVRKGKIHTLEHRAKISEAGKGRLHTPATRSRISAALKVRHQAKRDARELAASEPEAPISTVRLKAALITPADGVAQTSPYEGVTLEEYLADHPDLLEEKTVRPRRVRGCR